MKIKRYINSRYYGAEDVHALNLYLKSLPTTTSNCTDAKKVAATMNTPKNYEDINSYVPGSDKYNAVINTEEKYKAAQEYLNSIAFKKEQILAEIYPDYIDLFKVSFTVPHTYIDYDTDEYVTGTKTVFFYWETWRDMIIKEPGVKLNLPYTRNDVDLIQSLIDSYNIVSCRWHAKEFCEKYELDYHAFRYVFDIDKVSILGRVMSKDSVMYSGEEFSIKQVQELIAAYLIAQDVKYIHEDKIVVYPRGKSFIDFIKDPLEEYKA